MDFQHRICHNFPTDHSFEHDVDIHRAMLQTHYRNLRCEHSVSLLGFTVRLLIDRNQQGANSPGSMIPKETHLPDYVVSHTARDGPSADIIQDIENRGLDDEDGSMEAVS